MNFPRGKLFISHSQQSLLFYFLVLFFAVCFFVHFSPCLFTIYLTFRCVAVVGPFFEATGLFRGGGLRHSGGDLFTGVRHAHTG